jgi:hypothetical protein
VETAKTSHRACINVYAGLTVHGLTGYHIVTGTGKHSSTYITKQRKAARNITSAEFRDVLKLTLLPQGSAIFQNQGLSF